MVRTGLSVSPRIGGQGCQDCKPGTRLTVNLLYNVDGQDREKKSWLFPVDTIRIVKD
jgi:hypothetical protein